MDWPLKLFIFVFILVPILCHALLIDAIGLNDVPLTVESDASAVYARPPRSRVFDNYNHYGFGNSISRGETVPGYGRPHGFGQQHGFGGHHHRLGSPFTFGSSHELADDSDEGDRPKPARGSHDHHHRLVQPPYQISGLSSGFNTKKEITDFQQIPTSISLNPKQPTTVTPVVISTPSTTTTAPVISSTLENELINIDLRFGRA